MSIETLTKLFHYLLFPAAKAASIVSFCLSLGVYFSCGEHSLEVARNDLFQQLFTALSIYFVLSSKEIDNAD